ncbi:hypothetical protein A4A49_32245 [Nicotiana attenuata]|uniref:RNase H type-1 domain-containing protein n=1 Tax=Nicotiana attenuata TaxID=49451 RepID=A0A1J6JAH4_NICAT|nr:hypothetical protein A4A49_32245 [Nicotiana attenuata]
MTTSTSINPPVALENDADSVAQNPLSSLSLVNVVNTAEVIGGKENGHGKTLTIKVGDPKGVGIPHILHECALAPLIDHRNDCRTPVAIGTQSDKAQDPDNDQCEEEQLAVKKNGQRIQLSTNQTAANVNNKIWLFWDQDFTGTLLDQDEQQMTIELKHVELGETIQLIVVYAKCRPALRVPLWENLRHRSTICNIPWCVIWDFNIIASIGKKIGEIPYQMNKSLDFLSMIEDYGLTDLGFYGPRYTWSNGRGPCSIVWKRLDRGLVNDNWLSSFPATTIARLASTGSNHSPLLMEINVRQDTIKKYFIFLNCWVKNESFMPLVQEVWNGPINGSALSTFHQKLKEVIFSMNPNSADGPDGMNEKVYQACWDVIKNDLLNVVLDFFGGSDMPRYMKNACLFLLPKVEFPKSFTEFRPISLSNFINKIISKLICSRLAPILPNIISANQSGFVRGRSISENIMLAQEIVQGIKKPNTGTNAVIKLNMAKAYDRVCSAKYGSKQSSMIRVLFSINSDINLLLRATYPSFHWPLHWNELYSTVVKMQHHICTSHVTWHKPEDGFVKLNTDGIALTNPGKIGAGAIIRDHMGRLIHAIASPLGEGTNNIAEIEAAIIGMKWCLENCHFKVHLETDSALLVHWINHEPDPPSSLEMQLQKLIDLCSKCHEFKCSHVFRKLIVLLILYLSSAMIYLKSPILRTFLTFPDKSEVKSDLTK